MRKSRQVNSSQAERSLYGEMKEFLTILTLIPALMADSASPVHKLTIALDSKCADRVRIFCPLLARKIVFRLNPVFA
jgi:hypothetical protein